ncbi:DUF1273 domain-containing protein [Deltaproteobacteria bacterium OttesenSCG-928-M10]|nr:DUF1273 domain-containing protein [Deltaproteobacteria bacterium OttesenSCG-928-M10]
MSIEKTACFSGHRPQKLYSLVETSGGSIDNLRENVRGEILKAIGQGYQSFICGMAHGFDLICGCLVVEIKKEERFRDIQLVAAMPFPEHGFTSPWCVPHQLVLSNADRVETVCPSFNKKAYLERNRFMVDRSSLLICYFDGLPGGTEHTVRYAVEKHLNIVNLASAHNKGMN